MRRKNGFTLIELLAVIVVLAIIALIATPIVMNTIKNSKKGAAERTADNYVEQVETSLMTYRLENGENLPDGTYGIDSNGNLTGNVLSNPLTIEMNGTKPSSGSIVIDNGQVKKDGTTMKVGDYTVTYDTTNKTFVATESTGNNVEVLCEKDSGVDLTNLQYGDKFTCELGDNDFKTFYVLETSGDNVSLIMNMNIDSNGKGTTSGNTVAWSSDGSNHKDEDESQQAVTAKEYLSSSTASWTKLNPNQISLPTYDQIYKAAGNKTAKLPAWLYENLYVNSNDYPTGYWTSTPNVSDSYFAWFVRYDGYLLSSIVDVDIYYGIRPVITISKTQLG